MDKIVMIVAGGTGTRMNAALPKQFLLLENKPLLMHTLEVFRKFDATIRIILVLPGDQIHAWANLCKEYKFTIKHEICTGGITRFHSVKNNLHLLQEDSIVAIHDGVRPLVSQETIERCFRGAQDKGNAIPCIPIPETLRLLDGEKSRQVNRDLYRLIQTPQVFRSNILKAAYLQDYRKDFTDDAGVLEGAGYEIHLVEGNPENIKITYSEDLKKAAAIIRG